MPSSTSRDAASRCQARRLNAVEHGVHHDDFPVAPQLFRGALQCQPALCHRGADDAHASMHSAGAGENVGERVIIGMPPCPTILRDAAGTDLLLSAEAPCMDASRCSQVLVCTLRAMLREDGVAPLDEQRNVVRRGADAVRNVGRPPARSERGRNGSWRAGPQGARVCDLDLART